MPSEYRWSSHRAYLDDDLLPWLTTDLVLAQFGANKVQARNAYIAFMADGAGEEHRKEFHSGSHEGRILGDDQFADEVLMEAEGTQRKRVDIELLKQVVLEEFDCTMEELGSRSQKRSLSMPRSVMGWLAVQTGAASLTEVGKWFGRDVVTMSAAVRRLDERSERVVALRELLDKLLREVSRPEA